MTLSATKAKRCFLILENYPNTDMSTFLFSPKAGYQPSWPAPTCVDKAEIKVDVYLSPLIPPGNSLRGPLTFSFAKPCGTLKAHWLASDWPIISNKGQSEIEIAAFELHVLIASCSSFVSQPVKKSPW